MTDWSQLRHAYGPADDIPGLLAQAEPDMDSPMWEELWSRLCHQGTVYSASPAALPGLTEMAGRWSPADRTMPLVLAAAIVARVAEADVGYPSEIARLTALTEETLVSSPLDSDTYVYLLQALLAFEGVEVWGEELDRLNDEEFEVRCPHCFEDSSVEVSSSFAARMRDSGDDRPPLVPADPAELMGIGKRLYERATADGQPDIATKFTYVFGRADCPACGERFRVDEAVAAWWNG
jgi:hypothetical protein